MEPLDEALPHFLPQGTLDSEWLSRCLLCKQVKDPTYVDAWDGGSAVFCDSCARLSRADLTGWLVEKCNVFGDYDETEERFVATRHAFMSASDENSPNSAWLFEIEVLRSPDITADPPGRWPSNLALAFLNSYPIESREVVRPYAIVRTRTFHKTMRGYIQSRTNLPTGELEWSYQAVDPDMPAVQRDLWFRAMRKSKKRGAHFGTRKAFESYPDFLQQCRHMVADLRTRAQSKSLEAFEVEAWDHIQTGTITQEELARLLSVSRSALSRALSDYRELKEFQWSRLTQYLITWAITAETAEDD